MIIVQSHEDLSEVGHNLFPSLLIQYVSDLLEGLLAECEPGEEEDHLLSHPLILCEPEDRVKELLREHPFGLEYVEAIELPKGAAAFRVGVLLDHDWLAQYIVPASALDPDTLEWLMNQAEGASRHE